MVNNSYYLFTTVLIGQQLLLPYSKARSEECLTLLQRPNVDGGAGPAVAVRILCHDEHLVGGEGLQARQVEARPHRLVADTHTN